MNTMRLTRIFSGEGGRPSGSIITTAVSPYSPRFPSVLPEDFFMFLPIRSVPMKKYGKKITIYLEI
jgi:hypothetical protein